MTRYEIISYVLSNIARNTDGVKLLQHVDYGVKTLFSEQALLRARTASSYQFPTRVLISAFPANASFSHKAGYQDAQPIRVKTVPSLD